MGEIQKYFENKLGELSGNVNDKDYENVLKFDYGNKEMNELKNLFKEKLNQVNPNNFRSVIEGVDKNIEMLYQAQEATEQLTTSSIQQSVFQEIDYFQTKSKLSCLNTINTLNKKLKELQEEVTNNENKLEQIRKDNKKSTGKRILDFFGLSKAKDENKKKTEDKNAPNKEDPKKQLKELKKEIANIKQEISNSKSTLDKFKLVSKSAKDFQQKNFGIMTKKSVMNAIYNEKKVTGVIGCLSKVYKFLRQQYANSIFPKSKPPGAAFRELKKNTSNQRKQQPKYDKTKIKRMKNMLTDKEPKHFMECQRKLEEFSKLDLNKQLLNDKNLGENKFDIGAFNSLKKKLIADTIQMFDPISVMTKNAVETLNSKNSEQTKEKILNTYAKQIYKEKYNLIKKYTKLKNQFMKNVKKLLPKMKNRDELAQSLAALTFFNCIHSGELENKYQALFNETTVKKDLRDGTKIATIVISSVAFSMIMFNFILTITLVVIQPITILVIFLPVFKGYCMSSLLPIAGYYISKSLNKNDDLDAITGAIIEQSKQQ